MYSLRFLLFSILLTWCFSGKSQTRYIQTVVHVLYTNAQENLSDATVLDYIEEVNKGFAKQLSPTFTRTPDIFGSDWANTEIQLCLANLDPNNNSTNGITHTQINDKFMPTQNPGSPQNPVWNPSSYFNLYLTPVYNEPGFPNFVLGGWASSPTSPQMGASFDYVVVATNSISFIPALITHETGHFFGLSHLSEDNHADTPMGMENISPATGYSTNCSLALQGQNSTSVAQDGNHWGGVDPPDMVENFMGLSMCCQFMFTNDQADAMNAYIDAHYTGLVLANCASTAELIAQQNNAGSIQLFPNPVEATFTIEQTFISGEFDLEIRDASGRRCVYLEKIKNGLPMDASQLPEGFYTVRILDPLSRSEQISRFIKL